MGMWCNTGEPPNEADRLTKGVQMPECGRSLRRQAGGGGTTEQKRCTPQRTTSGRGEVAPQTEDTGGGPKSGGEAASRGAAWHLACEPAGGRAGRMSRGVGATGAERVACGQRGVFPTAWKTALLTGVADSSCPELETEASRPGTAALGRREAWRWGCSSAGGDTRPSSGETQRRRRRPQRPGPGLDLPSARGC